MSIPGPRYIANQNIVDRRALDRKKRLYHEDWENACAIVTGLNKTG